MPPFAFETDTAVTPVGPGRWRGTITDRWDIGVMPNGGYVIAVALAGVRAAVAQPDPLTVTAHYLGPCDHAPVDIEVDVLKEGRSLSTAMARVVQDDRVRLAVLATYGNLAIQDGPTLVTTAPPDIPGPDECASPGERPVPVGFAVAPSFFGRVEFRPSPDTADRITTRNGDRALIEGWVRFVDGRPADPQSLPLLCDAVPPAVFTVMQTGWVPTLELTVHVRATPSPGWLRVRVVTDVVVDGLLHEDCELWDASDQLVAMSRQLARVLPPGR